jgi:hypothetical protein
MEIVTKYIESPSSAVLIKGCAESTLDTKNLRDRFAAIWGINDQRKQQLWANVSTSWFQLHSIDHMVAAHGIDYMYWLAGYTRALYLPQHAIEDWRQSPPEGIQPPGEYVLQKFPFKEIAKSVDIRAEVFDNSISWLVATAVAWGYQRVFLTGIDFTAGERWALPILHYVIGRANGTGTQVFEIGNRTEPQLLANRWGEPYGMSRNF